MNNDNNQFNNQPEPVVAPQPVVAPEPVVGPAPVASQPAQPEPTITPTPVEEPTQTVPVEPTPMVEQSQPTSFPESVKPPKKKKLGLIIGIAAVVIVLIAVVLFVMKGKGENIFQGSTKLRLYSDSLRLVDGDIHKYKLYKANGDDVYFRVNTLKTPLIAYNEVGNDAKYHVQFALYDLSNESSVLEYDELPDNYKHVGGINTRIQDKEKDYVDIYNVALNYSKDNTKYEINDGTPSTKKISNSTSEVISIKQWGEYEYLFFIDINDKKYFEITYYCNPVSGCDLNGEATKEIIKFLESLQIELVDGTEETVTIPKSQKTLDSALEYYFDVKKLKIESFDKSLAPNNIHDYLGGLVTSLPITYENLDKKYDTYYHYKSGTFYGVKATDTVPNTDEVSWCVDKDTCYLSISFYDSYKKTVSEAMNSHKFFIKLSKYKTQLGYTSDNEDTDYNNILKKLGNPNEIYMHTIIKTDSEEADYWLVYNYKDYILAFYFIERSNANRTEETTYSKPYLEEVYYIDGDSFKDFINSEKSSEAHPDYYEYFFDVVVK